MPDTLACIADACTSHSDIDLITYSDPHCHRDRDGYRDRHLHTHHHPDPASSRAPRVDPVHRRTPP